MVLIHGPGCDHLGPHGWRNNRGDMSGELVLIVTMTTMVLGCALLVTSLRRQAPPELIPQQAIVDPSEMFRHLPFPFEDGRFPAQLGVVVQRTVADGKEPAREVTHAQDNSWAIGDGINDPNLPDACTVLHMHQLLQTDPTLEELALLPLNHTAQRDGPGRPWETAQLKWIDDL